MIRLIGISGKMQSGKDTVASIIKKLSYIDWEIVKFADTLKDITCLLLNCSREDLESSDFKSSPLDDRWQNFHNEQLTPRKVMQLIGTDLFRNGLHPNTWVNTLSNKFTNDSFWIVTDVRFPNEAEFIKNNGGILIRIERESIELSNHLSETALDDYEFDYIINNHDTFYDLLLNVISFMKKYDII